MISDRIRSWTGLTLALGIVACGGSLEEATRDGPRIAVGQFSMETCTFCPTPAGIQEWEFSGPPLRGAAVLERGSYVGGFVSRVLEYGDADLVGLSSPRYPVKNGWMTREAFEKYAGGMVEDLRANLPVDGLFVALHGATAVRGIPKPEAEFLRRLRNVVGDDVPIIVTLDLHANTDHELSDVVDAVVVVKQYPHADSRKVGEDAGRLMIRAIKGAYDPVMATRKPGVLTPSVLQWTRESPALDIMERARVWEAQEEDAIVSVALGHESADVPDIGATVLVVTNGDQALADRIAEDMSKFIWDSRHRFFSKHVPALRDGVSEAIDSAKAGRTPVIVADHADLNGDATWVLAELLEQRAENFVIATIADSVAIERLKDSGVGSAVTVDVGGTSDERAGAPVTIEGYLEHLAPRGRRETVAVVRFGSGNRVILTTRAEQVTSPRIFEDVGIPLDSLDIIVLKSRVNFRRGFYDNGLAGHVVLVDAPGWAPVDPSKLPYVNAPTDLYPLVDR